MVATPYTLEDYVSDLRKIVSQETNDEKITARVRRWAQKFAGNPNCIRDEFGECDEEQGFGVHLLHEEENHDLAVFAIAWLPDRGTLAHDHKTWAVVVGIHGQEKETDWNGLDDGTRPGFAELECKGERVMTAGDVSTCLPNHIHTVWNVGKDVSMSLHTYGRHINFTGRSEFDPAKNEQRPLIVNVAEGIDH